MRIIKIQLPIFNLKSFLIPTLVLTLIILAFVFKLLPYLVYDYEFLIGFDTGKYLYDFNYGLSQSPESIDLWVEPGLNTTLKLLDVFIDTDGITYYKFILPFFITVNLIILIFLITRHLTGSTSAAILSSIYLATSTVFLTSTFESFYRQLFASILLLNFLYFLEVFYKRNHLSMGNHVLLGILGGGIIFSHRAITLLFFMILCIFVTLNFLKNNFSVIRSVILIITLSFTLSSIYWSKIVLDNLTVIKDTIFMSLEGKHGGASSIKAIARNDNQLLGYLQFIPASFIAVFGLMRVAINRSSLYSYFLLLLIIYILSRATFSSRYLVNLEFLLSVGVGFAYIHFSKILNKRLFLLLISGLIVLNFVFISSTSIARRPYASKETEGSKWLYENIDKQKSIILAPDALSTLLGQRGYRPAIYEYKANRGEIDSLYYVESVLSTGYQDTSIINRPEFRGSEIYVVFGDWNITNPLPKQGTPIPVISWDESPYFEKIYEGDSFVRRVYRMKKE